jgi:hypothetical protein
VVLAKCSSSVTELGTQVAGVSAYRFTVLYELKRGAQIGETQFYILLFVLGLVRIRKRL